MCQRKGIERKKKRTEKEKDWMRKSKPQNGRRMDVKRELLQVVLFQINIFSHPNTTTYFFFRLSWNSKHKFCRFWISEQFVKIFVYLTKSVVIFWINWWQNMLIWQRKTCKIMNLFLQFGINSIQNGYCGKLNLLNSIWVLCRPDQPHMSLPKTQNALKSWHVISNDRTEGLVASWHVFADVSIVPLQAKYKGSEDYWHLLSSATIRLHLSS